MQSFLILGGTFTSQLEKIYQLISTDLNLSLPHPDLLIIESPNNNSIGIDQIKTIINFCSHKPYSAKHKIIIIKDAHLLTTEAQNSLLKTLEEPPPQVLIFLLSVTNTQLLQTITSRCAIVNLAFTQTLISDTLTTNAQTLIENLLKSDIASALKVSIENSQTSVHAKEFCQALITYLHNAIHTPTPIPHTPTLVRTIQIAINQLNANVNPRLVIDNLILQLHHKLPRSPSHHSSDPPTF